MPKGKLTTLDDLLKRMEELQERIDIERGKEGKRKLLLAHCEKQGFDRADLRWVINELPLERISHKHRVASVKKKGRGKPVRYHKFSVIFGKARRAKDLSPDEVADKVGRHVSSVHCWERGIAFPQDTLIPKLMEILGLPEAAFKRE
jgi:Helix-turn-helix domain